MWNLWRGLPCALLMDFPRTLHPRAHIQFTANDILFSRRWKNIIFVKVCFAGVFLCQNFMYFHTPVTVFRGFIWELFSPSTEKIQLFEKLLVKVISMIKVNQSIKFHFRNFQKFPTDNLNFDTFRLRIDLSDINEVFTSAHVSSIEKWVEMQLINI